MESGNDKVGVTLDEEKGQIGIAGGVSRENEADGVREGDKKEKTVTELKNQGTKRSFKDTKRLSLKN